MSTSSPFCLGTIISPRKPAIIPSFSPTNNNNNELQISQLSQALSINPLNIISSHPATSSALVRRREAIGFGLGLCFLLMPQWCNVASAAETAACEFTLTQSGLAYCDKAIGYGSQPTKGQLIKAHYVGKLENGTVFDSSYNRGKPLTFRIGVGEVIKGWDQGILGGDGVPPMLPGGKRTLKIPPELGYGARGAGCKGGKCIIPPDSVLLFDVEYVGKG